MKLMIVILGIASYGQILAQNSRERTIQELMRLDSVTTVDELRRLGYPIDKMPPLKRDKTFGPQTPESRAWTMHIYRGVKEAQQKWQKELDERRKTKDLNFLDSVGLATISEDSLFSILKGKWRHPNGFTVDFYEDHWGARQVNWGKNRFRVSFLRTEYLHEFILRVKDIQVYDRVYVNQEDARIKYLSQHRMILTGKLFVGTYKRIWR